MVFPILSPTLHHNEFAVSGDKCIVIPGMTRNPETTRTLDSRVRGNDVGKFTLSTRGGFTENPVNRAQWPVSKEITELT